MGARGFKASVDKLQSDLGTETQKMWTGNWSSRVADDHCSAMMEVLECDEPGYCDICHRVQPKGYFFGGKIFAGTTCAPNVLFSMMARNFSKMMIAGCKASGPNRISLAQCQNLYNAFKEVASLSGQRIDFSKRMAKLMTHLPLYDCLPKIPIPAAAAAAAADDDDDASETIDTDESRSASSSFVTDDEDFIDDNSVVSLSYSDDSSPILPTKSLKNARKRKHAYESDDDSAPILGRKNMRRY